MKTRCKPRPVGEDVGEEQLDGDYWSLVVSPDSKFLYVLGTVTRGQGLPRALLTVYARGVGAPGLRLVQEKLLPRAFAQARDVILSADGTTVFAAADPGVIGLARDRTTGRVSTIRACFVDAFSRRGDGFYVPGCQGLPISGDWAGKASALARLGDGSLIVVGLSGVWLIEPEAKRRGFWIKACAITSIARLCPSRVKRFEFPPNDAAVMENGRIVLSNDIALFAVAARNVDKPGGIHAPSNAVPKNCTLITPAEAARALSLPTIEMVSWPRWCTYATPNGRTKNLMVTWSPNQRMSQAAYRKEMELYSVGTPKVPGIGDLAIWGSSDATREVNMMVWAKRRSLETTLCCFGKAGLERLKAVTATAVRRLPN